VLVSPSVRPIIDTVSPLYALEAPKGGSGKGLLVSVLTIIAAGRPAEVIPEASDNNELRKAITDPLLGGAAMALIDNVRKRVDEASL
jgi:hypothetical protein